MLDIAPQATEEQIVPAPGSWKIQFREKLMWPIEVIAVDGDLLWTRRVRHDEFGDKSSTHVEASSNVRLVAVGHRQGKGDMVSPRKFAESLGYSTDPSPLYEPPAEIDPEQAAADTDPYLTEGNSTVDRILKAHDMG